MSGMLAAGGGFLLAVLWMDLMFDVQVLRYPKSDGDLPEAILASISGYYARVTTGARPMNFLIAAVMLSTVFGCLVQLFAGRAPLWAGAVSLVLSAIPIGLARIRVIQNAIRLGRRSDLQEVQSELARTICRDHLACFVAILLFVGLQILVGID
jgi:hypothetical protein